MQCDVHHPYLTFRHWSGVTPYTSSYEFAGSCVFGKQSPGNLSLRPPHFGLRFTHFKFKHSLKRKTISEVWREALSRSYGCFFAEFLGKISPVRLGLLDHPTCVGLGYGHCYIKLRSFSWKALRRNCTLRREYFALYPSLAYPGFS